MIGRHTSNSCTDSNTPPLYWPKMLTVMVAVPDSPVAVWYMRTAVEAEEPWR